MPEGPSIVILADAVREFEGRRVIDAGGNTKEDISVIPGQKINEFKTWGKHFLICFDNFIHGVCRNEHQNGTPAGGTQTVQ